MEGHQQETAQMMNDSGFILGDGNRIRLWEDSWCGDCLLKEAFPNLYRLDESEGVKVAEAWDTSTGAGAWNPTILRSLNNWEMEES